MGRQLLTKTGKLGKASGNLSHYDIILANTHHYSREFRDAYNNVNGMYEAGCQPEP